MGMFFEEGMKKILDEQEEKKCLRKTRSMGLDRSGRWIELEGKKYLNFSSNNYLGLAGHPKIISAARKALKEEGAGGIASRLVCGNHGGYERLEKKLAEFKETEAALVFSTGYHANLGIIPALVGRSDIVFSDRLNHASIVDACRLSMAKVERFRHGNIQDLSRRMEKYSGNERKLIVTDGIFSMDGDFAPLDEIAKIARKHGAWVMVDEAHATGIFGKKGRGAVEHFGIEPDVQVQMGTFSKALGGLGGYVAGTRTLIEYLKNSARTFIYTTALPPAVVAGNLAALELIEAEPERRKQLIKAADRVREELKKMGFSTGESETQIIPVIFGENKHANDAALRIQEQGIYVLPIRPPTVPEGTARLRITLSTSHTDEDIDRLLSSFRAI